MSEAGAFGKRSNGSGRQAPPCIGSVLCTNVVSFFFAMGSIIFWQFVASKEKPATMRAGGIVQFVLGLIGIAAVIMVKCNKGSRTRMVIAAAMNVGMAALYLVWATYTAIFSFHSYNLVPKWVLCYSVILVILMMVGAISHLILGFWCTARAIGMKGGSSSRVHEEADFEKGGYGGCGGVRSGGGFGGAVKAPSEH